MQCLQLTRGDPPAAPSKWYFNKNITLPEKGTTFSIGFITGDTDMKYHKLSVVLTSEDGLCLVGHYYVYIGNQVPASKNLYTERGGWIRTTYRTITFDTPPTGYLLVWLKANAVPQ